MNKKKKKLLIILVIAVVAAAAITAGAILLFGGENKSYRNIRIYNMSGEGTATVERQKIGEINAYIDMRLQSGDVVHTGEDSYLQLQMDEDKYCLIEPNTVLELIAEGDGTTNRTIIILREGSVVTQIDGKLDENSEFRITTSNSTIAVRGTCFRVAKSEDEMVVSVMEGTVECHTVQEDGTEDEEAVYIPAGTAAIVAEAPAESGSAGGAYFKETAAEVIYEDLPEGAVDFLHECIEERNAEIDIIWKVEFRVNGKLFGYQKVTDNGTVVKPTLRPTENGYWDFDFTQTVTGETIINWVEGK